MRRARPFFRAARLALILAALGGAWAHGATAAAASPPPSKENAAPTKIVFSPEIEAKLKDVLDKSKVAAAKAWDTRMQKEIDDVAGVTGLGDEGKRALAPAAKQAVAVSVEAWSVKLDDWIRKVLMLQPDQVSMMLDQMTPGVTPDQLGMVEGFTEPFDQDDWIKALHQTLTPAQAAVWDQAQAERKAKIETEIGDTLKQGAERIRDQQLQQMLSECGEIELAVGLPQERAAKLEALAKTVVDQTTDMWRKRVERMLIAMDDDQRPQYSRNGNIFIGTEDDESPDAQPAWKDGVAGLLTADEAARLQVTRDNRKAKRARAMGDVMIMVLDEKIAFTAVQRKQLQPIADRIVKEVPELFPDNGTGINGYYEFPPGIFIAAAAKATAADLKPILDETQLHHWQHLSEPANAAANPDDGQAKPEENTEPEEVEKVISNFLYEKTETERQRVLATNLLRAEDAVRVAGLSTETATRLQIATRGATEEYLANWKWFTEQQIRSQLQDVTPQNVRQRLDSFEDYFFQRNFPTTNRQGVWEKTVQVELTPAEQASWQKELDARKAFREQAIAALIMVEFDRKTQLTADQWTKLEPLIAGIIHDYGPDISQVFSPFNAVPWYMGSAYLLMPFAGVPEDQLKAILSKDQLNRWNGSVECSNANNLWQNIQQFHNQRANHPQANQGQGVRVIRTIKLTTPK